MQKYHIIMLFSPSFYSNLSRIILCICNFLYHCAAYDPWGKLLADAGGYDGKGTSEDATTTTIISSRIIDDESSSPVRVPSISIVDIDLDKASVRERMPIQQHRDNSSFS